MNRTIRYGTLIGAVLLGAGCAGESEPPSESNLFPAPEYVDVNTVPANTVRVSGLAWDPEAFFFTLANCGQECPFPPLLSEGNPLYLQAAVNEASVLAFDPTAAPPNLTVGDPATSDPTGSWLLPSVPERKGPPFFAFNPGAGAVTTSAFPPAPAPPLLPPTPPSPYVPTVTARPIYTGKAATCLAQESVHISRGGILEAVAKFLSSTGTPTLVDDLLNPARYYGVNVFWFFHAGNPAVKAPADSISLEPSTGQMFVLDWAPPGVLPPFLQQSTRGYYVTNTATSPIGVYVVLFPNSGPPPTGIEFKVMDTKEDAAVFRPWAPTTLPGNIGPGAVTFYGWQMMYTPKPNVPAPALQGWVCLPP